MGTPRIRQIIDCRFMVYGSGSFEADRGGSIPDLYDLYDVGHVAA